MSLEAELDTILGLTPPPIQYAAAASVATKVAVPERPTPLYEFDVRVSRNEYGSATIIAADADDASMQLSYTDIDWYDSGDYVIDDITQDGLTPHNQDELDEWDENYAAKYTHDGYPKCSHCDEETAFGDLRDDPNDDTQWLCPECHLSSLSDHE